MESAKAAKRIYLINRDFQFRYALAAALVGIVSTILTAVALLYPLFVFEILRIPRFLPWPILVAMMFAVVLNIMMIATLAIFITHRIAGPMFALVRAFRKIESGKWAGHLRIRERDEMHYVVRNFNQMIDSLIRAGREDLRSLEKIKENLESDKESAGEEIESLSDKIDSRIGAADD